MNDVHVCKGIFGRFIIVKDGLAWSGSRWVAVQGDTQICNFATVYEAEDYARHAGLIGPESRRLPEAR